MKWQNEIVTEYSVFCYFGCPETSNGFETMESFVKCLKSEGWTYSKNRKSLLCPKHRAESRNNVYYQSR